MPTVELARQCYDDASALSPNSCTLLTAAAGLDGAAARKLRPALVSTPGPFLSLCVGMERGWLRGLRYLIVDEADRLLGQRYGGWLQKVRREINVAFKGGEGGGGGGKKRRFRPGYDRGVVQPRKVRVYVRSERRRVRVK